MSPSDGDMIVLIVIVIESNLWLYSTNKFVEGDYIFSNSYKALSKVLPYSAMFRIYFLYGSSASCNCFEFEHKIIASPASQALHLRHRP